MASDEVKKMFMDWFKNKRAVAGHLMSKQDVVKSVLTRLDAKQEDALEKAMDGLKSDGLIEMKEDGVTLILTKKGADRL